ncbi:MAG: GNAT family N-acetyltransferase [Alphaproteobacteria bacterium]|nr:GNAT family N-acetyltransferase [Alphaproteobacteria bacterium]
MGTPHPPAPVLETERLVLRPLAPADADGLHEAYGDAQAMRFWDFPASADVAETALRIARSLDATPWVHACWAIVPKGTDRCRGMVNYHSRQAWNRRLEIGYILARPLWRQGLMREALGAFVGHCFAGLGAHRIEATIEPGNVASAALALQLGFRCEGGPMRDRLLVAGKFRSLMMYGLIEDEWASRGSRG